MSDPIKRLSFNQVWEAKDVKKLKKGILESFKSQ